VSPGWAAASGNALDRSCLGSSPWRSSSLPLDGHARQVHTH
jgi:hypothetical protein